MNSLAHLQPEQILRMVVFGMEILLTTTLIVWLRNKQKNKISWRYYLEILFFGGLVAIISAIVEIRYMIRINNQTATYDFLNSLNASVVEEIAKYAVGVFAILYSSKIHRITDVITFMIIVGLGFAITEDAVYLLNPSINAPERLISFYLHSGTAAIMGYAMGQLRFGLGGYRNLLRAIFYAIFLHLAYNSCSLLSNDKLGLWLSLGVVVCIGLQVIITFRKATANDIALEENNIPTKLLHL